MKPMRLRTATASAFVVAAIAGVAWASIPGPGNVYTACMLKGLGTVRLIDKSLPSSNLMSRCTDRETEISWNQAGQPGPAGPQGAKGDPGAAGTNGTNGTDGADGASVTNAVEPPGANCAGGGSQFTVGSGAPTFACHGAPGKDGQEGEKGDKGDTGPTGPIGPQGPPGPGLGSLDELNGVSCRGGHLTRVSYGTGATVEITCGLDPFEPNDTQATFIGICATCGSMRDLEATIDPSTDEDRFTLAPQCLLQFGTSLLFCSFFVELTGNGAVMSVNGGPDTTRFQGGGPGFISPPNPIEIRVHSTSGLALYTLTVSNPAGF